MKNVCEMIGPRIRHLRLKAGYSQEELAIKAKLGRRTIQKIENNKISPTLRTIRFISAALGVGVKDMLY